MTNANTHGGPGRGQGRKPATPGQPSKLRSIRLTDQQWETLKRRGVDALRAWLNDQPKEQA